MKTVTTANTASLLSSLAIPLDQVVENLHHGVVITDAKSNIQFVNTTFCKLTGYSPEEVLGRNPRLLQSGEQSAAFYRNMWKKIHEVGHWTGEICNRRKNGELYTESLTVSALQDAGGRITHYLGIFSDISEKKRLQDATWHDAHHDPLTGLPNRPLFLAHLRQAISRAKRTGTSVAVLFVDLDHFKDVNDTLGHSAGDTLLRNVALQIKSALRDEDIVARFGGDEFLVMLPGAETREQVFHVAQKILEAARTPLPYETFKIHGTASGGISIFPSDGTEVETLLSRADAAMYNAKRAGGDRFEFFLKSKRGRPAASAVVRRWQKESRQACG